MSPPPLPPPPFPCLCAFNLGRCPLLNLGYAEVSAVATNGANFAVVTGQVYQGSCKTTGRRTAIFTQ